MTQQEIANLERLRDLVKTFFEEYLEYTETHGLGERVIHPINIHCCRALMSEPLGKLLKEMKEIACHHETI